MDKCVRSVGKESDFRKIFDKKYYIIKGKHVSKIKRISGYYKKRHMKAIYELVEVKEYSAYRIITSQGIFKQVLGVDNE